MTAVAHVWTLYRLISNLGRAVVLLMHLTFEATRMTLAAY